VLRQRPPKSAPPFLRDRPTRAKAVGILVLEIDHLKAINEAHRHEAGDGILEAMCEAKRVGRRHHACHPRARLTACSGAPLGWAFG